MASSEVYRQELPAIGLLLERNTGDAPRDGKYYLSRDGTSLGAFTSLKAAQSAWREAVKESGWKPERKALDPAEMLLRESVMRENERFNEYWGSSHKFRAKGGIHRNR